MSLSPNNEPLDAMREASYVLSRLEHGKDVEGYRDVAEAIVREWLDCRLHALSVNNHIFVDGYHVRTTVLRETLLGESVRTR